MSDYHCAECGAEAFVQGGVVVRTCTHEVAAVLAPRTSMLYGSGGIDPPPGTGLLGDMARLLKRLLRTKGA